MSPISASERAEALLKVLGLSSATHAASGRYVRSLPIAPGVRYWATSQPRLRQDFLGVQFYGQGVADVPRRAERLKRAGFQQRTPQTGQITFAKPVSFGPADSVDADAIRATRSELDAILSDPTKGGSEATVATSFRQFMLASPLADAELTLPSRPPNWRSGEL